MKNPFAAEAMFTALAEALRLHPNATRLTRDGRLVVGDRAPGVVEDCGFEVSLDDLYTWLLEHGYGATVDDRHGVDEGEL